MRIVWVSLQIFCGLQGLSEVPEIQEHAVITENISDQTWSRKDVTSNVRRGILTGLDIIHKLANLSKVLLHPSGPHSLLVKLVVRNIADEQ